MDFSTSSSRWTALTTRNRLADTHFVYAVKTTKIYCRPSCAARLARRANVEFYSTPAAATKAGFRACKRCKPDLEPQDDPQDVAVAKACEIIRAAMSSTEHANGHVGLNELAGRVQLTPSYLHKTFKAKTGLTPKAYEETLRQQMEASDITAWSETEPVRSAATYDAHSRFASDMTSLDFDIGGMNGFDAVSDTAGMISGGFSEVSTSINTPMTTDWSWLDAQNPENERCEFFDPEALAQAMSAQDQVGWNDHLYLPSGRDWELIPGADVRQNVFDMENSFGRTPY